MVVNRRLSHTFPSIPTHTLCTRIIEMEKLMKTKGRSSSHLGEYFEVLVDCFVSSDNHIGISVHRRLLLLDVLHTRVYFCDVQSSQSRNITAFNVYLLGAYK